MDEKNIAEEKKVTKIVKKPVSVVKKGFFQKAKEALVSDDSSNIGTYILQDVLIPALKEAISDVVTNGIDILLYGESGKSHLANRKPGSRIQYSSLYDGANNHLKTGRRDIVSERTRIDYEQVVISTRPEAQSVLDQLQDMIDRYQIASIADLYDSLGITPRSTDHNYGWTDISSSTIIHVKNGWVLNMPKAMPIT